MAITPSRPAPSNVFSHCAPSSGSSVVRVTWHHCLSVDRLGQRLAAGPERLLHQRRVPDGERVEPDEVRRRLLGEHLDAAGGGVDALAERFPVQPDAAADLAGDDDLAVEHTARRQLVAQRVEQLREVPAEVLAAAGLQHDVVAVAEQPAPGSRPTSARRTTPRRRRAPSPGLWPASARSVAVRGDPRFPYSRRPPTPGNVIGVACDPTRRRRSDREGATIHKGDLAAAREAHPASLPVGRVA